MRKTEDTRNAPCLNSIKENNDGLFVPAYNSEGFSFVWEDGFSIKCSINDNLVIIEANKSGLISLARHSLELAQENVPEYEHIHLDEHNSLDNNSAELIIVKRNQENSSQ